MTQSNGNDTETPSSENTAKQPHVIGVHGVADKYAIANNALSEVLNAANNAGATVEIIDLAELKLPLYNPDRTEPESTIAFIDKISQADAVVLATSVTHDSYSALLKNALDYCDSEAFDNKPVGLLAVTERSGPALALEHLRTVCRTLNARVPPMQVSINATWEDSELPEESVDALRKLGKEVVSER